MPKHESIEQLKAEIERLKELLQMKDNHIKNLEASRAFRLNRAMHQASMILRGRGSELLKWWEKAPNKNRQAADVFVIIPNYNYAKYLKRRIGTIANQTLKVKHILFLDDNSSDNSVELAKKLLKKTCIPFTVLANDKNEGCFAQWLKGIKMANAEFVWIAEADDACEPTLLEQLLNKMLDKNVVLAYAQSDMINASSEYSGSYTSYLARINNIKWTVDYTVNGTDEIKQALGAKNTIPNASACLMRASAFSGLDKELLKYTAVGDWFTYIYLAQKGMLAFCCKTLNHHRRHEQSIISRQTRDMSVFLQTHALREYVLNNFELSINALREMQSVNLSDMRCASEVCGDGKQAELELIKANFISMKARIEALLLKAAL